MKHDNVYTKCKSCSTYISNKSSSCPHCGKNQKKMTPIKWFAFYVILVLTYSIITHNKPFSTNKASSTQLVSGYSSQDDMSKDVELLALTSLRYKTERDSQAYENAQMMCRHIDNKIKRTSYLTEKMENWMQKVEQICLDY